VISIYCSEKLDGLAAAAIVMRHATLSKLPAHFGGFLHPDTLTDELKEMAKEVHKLIFVTDISLEPDHLSLLEAVSENNKLVYWNTSDPKSIIPEAKIFDKAVERKCSAELACERFLPNDLIAKQLARLAHEVKFWEMQDERASKLSDVIAAQYNPLELLDTLAKGVFWNQQLEEFHKSYRVRKEAALDELMKSLKIKRYVTHSFGFSLVSSMLNSADACQHMLDGHAGVDVAVVLYRDGRIAFRRRDNVDVDVKELAELFKGGGHPFAAGARLNRTITKENLPDVLFQIDQSFKNFFVGATVS